MTKAKRILVTGGAGFIGSHIVDALLAAGHQVVVLDNLTTGKRQAVNHSATFIEGDVRRPEDLRPIFDHGLDAVFHIAGQASIRLSFTDPAADLGVNTLGTVNILQQCITHRVPRLLFASSMTVYGNTEINPIPETTPVYPVSNYAVTKYAAERYVHIAATRADLGFDFGVTSFRMFNVYGERQSLTNAYQGVFAIFLGNLLRGEPINIHSDGEQSRDFVHVSDVVRAWILALDQPASHGQVINLGTGQGVSVNQLCDLVLASAGKTRANHPVIYHPAQPGDMRRSTADVSKARTILGWEPQVRFEDGMAATIRWAQEISKTQDS
ncbi:MAG TPA: NAD-dependent epimerase/dehydratase family protein [Aggregatilineales bacterium]|nr:NAD-dependent epimerase/dehydratase family protein [Aggregatilineales bacterium]